MPLPLTPSPPEAPATLDLLARALRRLAGRRLDDELGAAPVALDGAQREVLRLRLGLDRGGPRTLGEVGWVLGLEAEEVLALETSALRLLHGVGAHTCADPAETGGGPRGE